DVTAGANGAWSLTIGKGVTAGHYVVRADAVGENGKVAARAEVPFDVPVAVAQAAVPKPTPNVSANSNPDANANAGAGASGANGNANANAPASPDQTASTDTSHAVVAQIDTATVTRGDSLWRISQRELGEGIRYTLIYKVNASQIRDPNLIYPGQVFVMPHTN
ncbi:MAG TPA: LysM peptidoglycan-binding domain-containing protein, partial [Methylovirgula sp.]